MVNVTNGNPPYWKDKYSSGKPKKSGKSLAFTVGCSILAVLVVLSLIVVALIVLNKEKPNETAQKIEELRLEEKPAAYYENLNVEEVLHEGMSKDSVLMVLGKPSAYRYTNWADDILYEFNDTCYLQVWFENGKVSGIDYKNRDTVLSVE